MLNITLPLKPLRITEDHGGRVIGKAKPVYRNGAKAQGAFTTKYAESAENCKSQFG
jgi:hypothetical protein